MSDKEEIEGLKARIEELENKKESSQDEKGNLEEIKETLKKIEKKPGCLKQFGYVVLVLLGIAFVGMVMDELDRRDNIRQDQYEACIKNYERHPMKEQAKEICKEKIYE